MVLGAVCALIGGALQPYVLIIGGLITDVYLRKNDSTDYHQFWNDVMVYIKAFAIFFAGSLISSFLQVNYETSFRGFPILDLSITTRMHRIG